MTNFIDLVQSTLSEIATIVDDQLSDFAEADFQGDVLVITLNDNRQFVLNRNVVHQQLWLSSPFSGAWHFSYHASLHIWKSTRGTEELQQILSQEFTELIGREIQF